LITAQKEERRFSIWRIIGIGLLLIGVRMYMHSKSSTNFDKPRTAEEKRIAALTEAGFDEYAKIEKQQRRSMPK
jgi:hypothetical protein